MMMQLHSKRARESVNSELLERVILDHDIRLRGVIEPHPRDRFLLFVLQNIPRNPWFFAEGVRYIAQSLALRVDLLHLCQQDHLIGQT